GAMKRLSRLILAISFICTAILSRKACARRSQASSRAGERFPSLHGDGFVAGIASSRYAAHTVEFIAFTPYCTDASASPPEIFRSDGYNRIGVRPVALTRRKRAKHRRASSSVVLPFAVESRRTWKSGWRR